MNQKGYLSPLYIIPCLLFIALKICFAFWSVDKGFDIGDEGFYMLGVKYAEEYKHIFFLLAVKKLTFFFDPNLINMRIARNILELFASVFLSFSVGRYVEYKTEKKGLVLYFVILGLLACLNSFYARALSYNDVANAGGYIGFGILLRLVEKDKFSWFKILWALLFGIVAGYMQFVKPPLWLGLYVLLFLTIISLKLEKKWLLFSIAVICSIVINILYVLALGGYKKLYEIYVNLYPYFTKLDYGIGNLLLYHSVFDLLPLLLFTGLFVYLLTKTRNHKSKTVWFLVVHAIFFILFFFAVEPFRGYLNGVLIATSVGFVISRRKTFDKNSIIVYISLVSLPGFISAGSADSVLMACFMHLVPVFLGIGVVVFTLSDSLLYTKAAFLYLFLISLSYFARNQIFKPFGLSAPIYTCTHEAQIAGQILKFNSAEADFFNGLEKIMDEKCHFKKGDEIISLEFAPGFIYAVGGFARFHPFYHPYIYEANCFMLNQPRPDSLPKPIILTRSMAQSEIKECLPHLLGCLDQSPLSFKTSYHLVDSIDNPFSYSGFYFNSGSKIYFYIPNKK